MTDVGFLADFMIPVIVGICLCVGYVIKKWVKDVDNKYIPTVCALLGVILCYLDQRVDRFACCDPERIIQRSGIHRTASAVQAVYRKERR